MNDESVRVERLAGLCRIWGAAKFFHPYLAYKDIDWDAALVSAIPVVNAARSPEDYANAVSGLLSALDDPATRVLPAGGAEDAGPTDARQLDGAPSLLWRGKTAVLQAAQLSEMGFGAELAETVTAWFSQLEEASAVVFDLRVSGLYYVSQQLASVAPRLLEGDALEPSRRTRMHSGYTTDGAGSGAYSSGFYITDGLRLIGSGGGLATKPIAVVLNEDSGFPGWVLALQSAGRARVVFSGDPRAVGACEVITLPEGVRVLLRTSEEISGDGSLGFAPDVTVEAPAEEADYFAGPALTAAFGLIDGTAASAPERPQASLVTPYTREKRYEDSPFPDVQHRLLALFRYWTVMDLFFPYKDHLDQPWDQTLAEGIPLLEAATDETEYALALAAVNSNARDTHCFLGSNAFNRWLGTHRPPVIVRLIEGRTVVTHLAEAVAGLSVGDVLLSVDGVSTEARRDLLRPYISASTPHAMDWRLDNSLLAGAEGSDAVLAIERADLSTATIAISRDRSWVEPPVLDLPTFGVLPSGLGYFDLARLVVHQVNDAFEAVRETPALIIDDRCYPNGTAWSIAPRLADGPVAGALFRRPEPRSPDRDLVHEYRFMQTLPPAESWRYKKPVVMLINGEAISQAEHTCLLIDAACKPTFVGSATNGANGDVTTIQLPGGVRTMFSGHDVRHADGRQLQRVGIQPDIEVHPTIDGIRAGRDEVLEAAVAFLNERRPP